MLPKCSAHCQPRNLAFSAAVSRRPLAGGLASRVLMRPSGFNFKNLSFSVRAEANPEADLVLEEEIQENAAEEEALVFVSDDKPPYKPRIKLGDVMGVTVHFSPLLQISLFLYHIRLNSNFLHGLSKVL